MYRAPNMTKNNTDAATTTKTDQWVFCFGRLRLGRATFSPIGSISSCAVNLRSVFASAQAPIVPLAAFFVAAVLVEQTKKSAGHDEIRYLSPLRGAIHRPPLPPPARPRRRRARSREQH